MEYFKVYQLLERIFLILNSHRLLRKFAILKDLNVFLKRIDEESHLHYFVFVYY